MKTWDWEIDNSYIKKKKKNLRLQLMWTVMSKIMCNALSYLPIPSCLVKSMVF